MTFHYSSDEIFCKDCVQAVTEYLVRFKDPLESECAEVERDLGVIWNCLCSLCRSFSFNILSEIIGLGMCWSWSWSGGRWNSELYADFSTSLFFSISISIAALQSILCCLNIFSLENSLETDILPSSLVVEWSSCPWSESMHLWKVIRHKKTSSPSYKVLKQGSSL